MYPFEHRFRDRQRRSRRRCRCRLRFHIIPPVPESDARLKMSDDTYTRTAPYNRTMRNKDAHQLDSLFVCATRDFGGLPGLIERRFAYYAGY